MDRPVDRLTDRELSEINMLHGWDHYTLDSAGRKLGNPHGRHYPIPHPLVLEADKHLDLKGRDITEFGCLEGAHTIALDALARDLLAIDVRWENLLKSAVRCGLYGVYPDFELFDVEEEMPPPCDVYFHVGVLYHLADPVQHLRRLGEHCHSLFLDTHYTQTPDNLYQAEGKYTTRCQEKPEKIEEIRAAVRPVSRWLTLGNITEILGIHFTDVAVISDRQERNGPRCTIIAKGGPRAR